MKRGVLLVTIGVLILTVIILAYFYFFNIPKCDNYECFADALIKCKRSDFIGDSNNLIISYKILGKSGDYCLTNVKVSEIKKGSLELAPLLNKEMECSTPFGVLSKPEGNLKNCHGELRELLQETVINRMHSQIVENIGKVSQELTQVL
jgi:hypothetical protein